MAIVDKVRVRVVDQWGFLGTVDDENELRSSGTLAGTSML